MLADESCPVRGSVDMKNKEVGYSEHKITEESASLLHFDPSNFQENPATTSCDYDRNEFIDAVLKDSGIFEPGQTFINISTQSAFATANSMMTEPPPISPPTSKHFTQLEVYHSPVEKSDIGINHEAVEYIETELHQTTVMTDPIDKNMHYQVENELFSNFLKTNGRQVTGRKRKSEEEIRWFDSFWRKRIK